MGLYLVFQVPSHGFLAQDKETQEEEDPQGMGTFLRLPELHEHLDSLEQEGLLGGLDKARSWTGGSLGSLPAQDIPGFQDDFNRGDVKMSLFLLHSSQRVPNPTYNG